jgi:hypothetical protein
MVSIRVTGGLLIQADVGSGGGTGTLRISVIVISLIGAS